MIRAVILDLDGVVYLEDRLLPGVAPAIAAMRRGGLTVLFATNNASHTRAGFARRLMGLGVPCAPGDLMNATHASVRWIARRLPRGSRCFTFGESGLAAELRAAGFAPVWCHRSADWRRFRAAPPRVGAVLVQFNRRLTYWDLCAAQLSLQRGAALVACNLDPTYPGVGVLFPGTGSLARLLQVSSGREPVLIGKPSPELFRTLLAEHRIRPRDTLVVGDRLPIDIAAGRALGARTALVLTGVDSRSDARRSAVKPDAILPSVADLPDWIARSGR